MKKRDENSPLAPVSEIFPSFQGEGIYAGKPQIFVRFADCNLSCGYCDAKIKKSSLKYLSTSEILSRIKKYLPVKSIAVTGGEPLLYVNFLKELLPELKKSGYEVYLETNGTLPENYRIISRYIDITAMDIKLPSEMVAHPLRGGWRRHFSFMKLLSKNDFIKIVLTSRTKKNEVKKAFDLIQKAGSDIPVVFQPVSPIGKTRTVAPRDLYKFLCIARRQLHNVNVTPQLHKLLWKIK